MGRNLRCFSWMTGKIRHRYRKIKKALLEFLLFSNCCKCGKVEEPTIDQNGCEECESICKDITPFYDKKKMSKFDILYGNAAPTFKMVLNLYMALLSPNRCSMEHHSMHYKKKNYAISKYGEGAREVERFVPPVHEENFSSQYRGKITQFFAKGHAYTLVEKDGAKIQIMEELIKFLDYDDAIISTTLDFEIARRGKPLFAKAITVDVYDNDLKSKNFREMFHHILVELGQHERDMTIAYDEFGEFYFIEDDEEDEESFEEENV